MRNRQKARELVMLARLVELCELFEVGDRDFGKVHLYPLTGSQYDEFKDYLDECQSYLKEHPVDFGHKVEK